MNRHMNNADKDGKETNPAISEIIKYKPSENKELEAEYKWYCDRIGFVARDKGAFGVTRKYWIL